LSAVTWTCAASAGSTCPASGSGSINATVSLPNGGSATFTVHATVTGTGTLTNTATIAPPSGVVDSNTANNSATDTDTIISPTADLSITKTDGVTNVVPGGTVTYTIVAGNGTGGNSSNTSVSTTVSDTVPETLIGITWTCTATAGSSCSSASGSGSNVIAVPVTLAPAGSATITVSGTVSNAVSIAGLGKVGTSLINTAAVAAAPTGVIDPAGNNTAFDTDSIALLDNFDMAIAASLDSHWAETTVTTFFGTIPTIGIVNNRASTLVGGNAFWLTSFGPRQAAAFTFGSAPANNEALVLKATGGTATAAPTNFIRVLYTTINGGTITVQTTTNGGRNYTTAGSVFTGTGFVSGDTLTAFVDSAGQVNVWRTTAQGVTSSIGFRTPLANALWSTGDGRIGMQLPAALTGTSVDNFSGGTMP
jgi:hypothetical protein